MVDIKYDLVERVEIGFTATVGQHTDILNIISYADRLVSPDDAHVDPINVINQAIPKGVHQNQKFYEMELVLDSHNHEAFYAQQVQAGVAASRAIREGADNDDIEYFRVFIRESDGSTTYYTYQSGEVWCIGETHEITNEQGERHPGACTYSFVCLGTRSRVGW